MGRLHVGCRRISARLFSQGILNSNRGTYHPKSPINILVLLLKELNPRLIEDKRGLRSGVECYVIQVLQSVFFFHDPTGITFDTGPCHTDDICQLEESLS
jgi:hypothetical protein